MTPAAAFGMALLFGWCCWSARVARRRDAFGNLGDAGDREGLCPECAEKRGVHTWTNMMSTEQFPCSGCGERTHHRPCDEADLEWFGIGGGPGSAALQAMVEDMTKPRPKPSPEVRVGPVCPPAEGFRCALDLEAR